MKEFWIVGLKEKPATFVVRTIRRERDTSSFEIPCSIFDILSDAG
jgi:hypothetical protein